MQKRALLLFSLVLVISLFAPMGGEPASAAFSYKKGDILITDSTSSKGVTGHAAIYIGGGRGLHTSGWKSEPYPTVMKIKNWENHLDHACHHFAV